MGTSCIYQPIAANYGPLAWSCPACGQVSRSKFAPGEYHVQCSNSACRRVFEHFDGFRPVRAQGPQIVRPRDTFLELAPMRRALLLPRRLSATECLNVVLDEEEQDDVVGADATISSHANPLAPAPAPTPAPSQDKNHP